MIKLTYHTDEGQVEASFEKFEELEAFKAKLKAAADAETEKAKEEARKRERDIEDRWDELKAGMKDLVAKAKDYGVSPEGFVALVKSAMFDQSDDRCEPGPCKYNCKCAEKQAEQIDKSEKSEKAKKAKGK